MYVQRFAHGEPAALDEALMHEVLRPYVIAGDRESMLIRAGDGSEADVYADSTGLMINRPQRGGIFAVTAELVDRLGAVLLLPGCPTLLRAEEDRPHLPEELRDDCLVIELTGAAIEAVLDSPHAEAPREPDGPGCAPGPRSDWINPSQG